MYGIDLEKWNYFILRKKGFATHLNIIILHKRRALVFTEPFHCHHRCLYIDIRPPFAVEIII